MLFKKGISTITTILKTSFEYDKPEEDGDPHKTICNFINGQHFW